MCSMRHTLRRRVRVSPQELALIGVAALWGGIFLVVHIAMQFSGPTFFVGIRFLSAGILSALLFHRSLCGMTRGELAAGFAIGVALFAGCGLQTFGLQTITASASTFITATYVPLAPILAWLH